MQFLGNIEAKLDAKNRVFIPAVFRRQMLGADGVVLYLRKDVYQNCINVYTREVWDKELELLRSKLNRWDPAKQDLFRQFLYDSEEVTPDSSGRILISKRLLNLVGIQSEVRFLGVGETLEIWPQEELGKTRLTPEDFAKQMKDLMSGL